MVIFLRCLAAPPVITLSPADVRHSVDLAEAIESAPARAMLVLPEGVWDDVSVVVERPLAEYAVGGESHVIDCDRWIAAGSPC